MRAQPNRFQALFGNRQEQLDGIHARELRIAPVALRVYPSLKNALEEAAKRDRRSVSTMAELILTDWLTSKGYLRKVENSTKEKIIGPVADGLPLSTNTPTGSPHHAFNDDAAFRNDPSHRLQGANIYTAFCRAVNGKGTTWISKVDADDVESAKQTAIENCAADWRVDEDTVECVGLAEGDVAIVEWADGK